MEENSSGRPANMMSFMSAMKSGFKNSFSLSGRASRSEYWFWVLGGVIFQMTMVIGSIVLAVMEVPVLPGLMILAPILLVPGSITLVVRRLHDVGMSGWMWFVALVPVIGLQQHHLLSLNLIVYEKLLCLRVLSVLDI